MAPDEFRAARKALGLSQAQMAERLGKAKSGVQRYEAGQTPVPQTVRKLVVRMLAEKE